MINQVTIACGTDDGVSFTSEHFGSASFYLVYTWDLEKGKIDYDKRVENTSAPEEIHGDPEKARSVTRLLGDVQILMGKVMGPNIARMRKKFVPVICRDKNIGWALDKIKERTVEIEENIQLPPGQDRKIIYLEEQKDADL